ncbi:hypothetical protein BCU94_17425 [Shewanella sp. 10N.286.52.C2]|uniref:hypothetical protein n=1 Tax=unclassified Shewanella TaxID=196818 RepID=UPI000C82863E|nr:MULTISPECIES: hypothetical protein [unclassified Shewanella]MDO6618262.1 hypothetical protein [Shewanella sp. 6_MG-2023]MDO6679967.1 hypothetical protein [Shewanella sp. 4_MG-2023]MDO6775670.1 hypothetical protein [Shewanella sp. 3_MG-2023]PMG28463.1 hypothetical protein BCU94_17425 [Shewanella sp. 10N.286.52.C2]PMH97246.1 hypothetical protein BCU55_17740 [Shewanella sp. 10N.286.48.A6]
MIIKEINITQKAIELFLIAIVVSVFLNDIIINEHTLAANHLWYLALAVIILSLYRLDIRPNKQNKIHHQGLKKTGIYSLLFIAIYLCGPLATARYGHVLLTTLGKYEHVNHEFIVKYVSTAYSSQYCTGAVYIKSYQLFGNDRICGVPKSLWFRLKKGDTLTVKGRQTSLAFEYQTVQLINNTSGS